MNLRSRTFFILMFVALVVASAVAQTNTIVSIRAVAGGVELELQSTREFPVRDEQVILRIGSVEGTSSRPPDDGSLDTLIFFLTSERFSQTATGDRVTVRYGRESTDVWDFGELDKSLVGRP